jgi:hypothetical protein
MKLFLAAVLATGALVVAQLHTGGAGIGQAEEGVGQFRGVHGTAVVQT